MSWYLLVLFSECRFEKSCKEASRSFTSSVSQNENPAKQNFAADRTMIMHHRTSKPIFDFFFCFFFIVHSIHSSAHSNTTGITQNRKAVYYPLEINTTMVRSSLLVRQLISAYPVTAVAIQQEI
jgi:hypothetical protein